MGMGPRLAAATLLAVASGPVGGAAVLAADEVPYNSKLELNAGGRAFEGTDGYLTLGGLAGVGLDPDYEQGFAFLDLRGHQLIEGDQAYNAALGYRWADWSDGSVWGVNAGLSGRSRDGDWYTWCNFGVERLSPDFDLRANGYLLCGDGEHDLRCEAQGFQGNSLLVANRADLGMEGFDVSLGAGSTALIPGTELYGKLEFYWFTAAYDDDALGGRAELEWQVHDSVALSGWVSHDTLFETSGLVGIRVSLGGPAERADRLRDDFGTGERLVSFIERRDLMAINEDALDGGSEGPLVDGNGDAIPFWHVDNTAAPGGDGTYERPFDTLAEAGAEAGTTGPGDVIIFHVGDGTTNAQQDGITLQDDQYFIAGSFDRTFRLGGKDIRLDSFFQEEGRPQMTDSDGDALRLADNNYTGGYDIVGAAQQGVSGDGIAGLTMFDVGIYGSGGSGVELTNSTGSFLFSGMTVSGNDGDFAVDDAGGGFNLLGMAGDITIEDTLCSDNGVAGGAIRQYDCVEISSQASGDLAVVLRNSRILDNWGNGFETHQTGAGRVTLLLEANLLQRNTESAITLNLDEGSGDADWTLRGNTIVDNGWSGLQLNKGGSGTLRMLVEGNRIADNTTIANLDLSESAGIALATSSGPNDLVIRDNLISGHAGNGIFMVTTPSESGVVNRVLISGNEITGNGFGRPDDLRGGITFFAFQLETAAIPSGFEVTLTDNLLAGNALYGMQAFVTSLTGAPPFAGGTICVNAQDNQGGDSLFLNAGTNQTQTFPGPVNVVRVAGGNLFQDPAFGGNANPVVTSGMIGSRACQTVQGF